MRLSRELRDRWGMLLGATFGGLTWAVLGSDAGVDAVAGIGVGAAVWVARAFAAALTPTEGRGRVRSLRIRPGSSEARWVERAERALRLLDDATSSISPGPIRDRSVTIRDQASTTMIELRALAGRASAVTRAMESIDADGLRDEYNRLGQRIEHAPTGGMRNELESSLTSARAQLEVFARLSEARAKLDARIQSVVLGLEALGARLIEILALVEAQSPTEGAKRIDDLADELEGLRAGLAETEELSRKVLSAFEATDTVELGDARGMRARVRRKGGRDVEAS